MLLLYLSQEHKMNTNAITIAIALVREIMPIIQDILEDVQEAKSANSDGGRTVTRKERSKIATDAVLAAVPKLHEILMKHI